MRILIVEDEIDLQEAIAEGLQLNGYAVDTCCDGNQAYEMLYVENYDLVLLDLNLPNMDGFEILNKIREEKPELKILILSARESVCDKVKGLDLGANDYLTKPFDFEELEARIRSLLRRKFIQENTLLKCGKIQVDLSLRTAKVLEHTLSLTKKNLLYWNILYSIKTELLVKQNWLNISGTHTWIVLLEQFGCILLACEKN